MALDFYRADNNEYLFGLEDKEYSYLSDIFKKFKEWTNIVLEQYSDAYLSIENQIVLLKVIEHYLKNFDFNNDKPKTIAILEFKGVIRLFVLHKLTLQVYGD